MTNREKLQEIFPNIVLTGTVMMYKPTEQILASGINYNWLNAEYEIPTNSTTKNNLEVDVISRIDALRVAKNEYLRGWYNALCKALDEEFSIHCEEGNFSVVQEETITGLGLSMDCSLGKDVESYMSTIPSVKLQEPRKRGHWINGNPLCPCCGEDKFKDLDADIWADWQPKYCPNCGADMREGKK